MCAQPRLCLYCAFGGRVELRELDFSPGGEARQ